MTKCNHTKRDIHQEITSSIIEAIEAGANGKEWVMPWHGAKGMPVNAHTKALYNGINVFRLWLGNYPSNTFASYKQWQDLGCQVKKGSKGLPIVFYKQLTKEVENAQGKTEEKSFPMLRYSTVFAAEQVDGYQVEVTDMPDLAERIDDAESFFNQTGISVKHEEQRAYYKLSDDYVNMPRMDSFIDTDHSSATENYYGTLSHECTHATGHKKRTGRREVIYKKYDKSHKAAYAFEELVAEMGSAFLCSHLSIESSPRVDHAQYIQGWLSILKEDNRAIFKAASLASQALHWMTDKQSMSKAA